MRPIRKEAHPGSSAGAHQVLLDGKPLRTPAKAPLDRPTRAVAKAVAAEWQAQAETVRPSTTPLARLAATAIDHQIRHPAAGQQDFAG
jgi:chaperone required for assembly of F1-ATPase